MSHIFMCHVLSIFFFFNDTATTEIYTLSLHDALPISLVYTDADFQHRYLLISEAAAIHREGVGALIMRSVTWGDRKSTRLNSSHANISYAVFCLKKKKTHKPKQN